MKQVKTHNLAEKPESRLNIYDKYFRISAIGQKTHKSNLKFSKKK